MIPMQHLKSCWLSFSCSRFSPAFNRLSIELVENIPDDLFFPGDGRPNVPLSVGFHTLLDLAKHSVEVVSPVWALVPWGLQTVPDAGKQVNLQDIYRLNFCCT